MTAKHREKGYQWDSWGDLNEAYGLDNGVASVLISWLWSLCCDYVRCLRLRSLGKRYTNVLGSISAIYLSLEKNTTNHQPLSPGVASLQQANSSWEGLVRLLYLVASGCAEFWKCRPSPPQLTLLSQPRIRQQSVAPPKLQETQVKLSRTLSPPFAPVHGSTEASGGKGREQPSPRPTMPSKETSSLLSWLSRFIAFL